SKIYLANDDFFKASEVVRYCLANINSKNYNKYYKEIWMLMDTISDKESGQSKIILWGTDILESHKNLSNEAKLYFILELKELYIKHGNYAKASEYAIKGCYLAYDLNDNYCLSRCMINLGRILREIENRDRAVELIKDALELPIEDKSHEAYRDVYAYINLGEIYLESGNYEEAKKTVENISSYKVYFDEEEFRNIEIRRILILADKNFYENNLDEGKKLLDKADELIKENKNNISSDVYLNYNSLHGTYLEQTTNYKEAIELYNEILQWCVDKNDIYNQRKIM
ncbi:tetratricopeptide repeat protein, partial [Clostridium butyricum]